MSLARCLKKVGLGQFEADILMGDYERRVDAGSKSAAAAMAAIDAAIEEVLNERIDLVKQIEKQLPKFSVDATHASPHDFDEFSTEFMGSGEGNQAFGWGLYFGSLAEVANAYRKAFMEKFGRAKTYRVELSPNEDEFLDWDLPLSEQSESVRSALLGGKPIKNLSGQIVVGDGAISSADPTGQDIYGMLQARMGPKAASEYLRSIGIPGNKYRDQFSRRMVSKYAPGEKSTYNFVVFDDKLITIKEKFSAIGPEAKAGGMEKAAVEKIVARAAKNAKDKHGMTIKVISDAESRRLVNVPEGKRAKGFILGNTIYLVHDNLGDKQDVEANLAHELVGHFGIEAVVKNWPEVVKLVKELMRNPTGEFKDILDEATRRYGSMNLDEVDFIKELIAVTAERHVKTGPMGQIMRKLRMAIRAFLKAFGIETLYGPSEIDAMLAAAAHFVETGRSPFERMETAPQFSAGADPFYSQALLAAGWMKQDKATPEQWLAHFKKNSVKQAELDWIDMAGFMAGKKSITKAEMQEFIRQNQVTIKEVVKGKTSKNYARQKMDSLFVALDAKGYQPSQTRDEDGNTRAVIERRSDNKLFSNSLGLVDQDDFAGRLGDLPEDVYELAAEFDRLAASAGWADAAGADDIDSDLRYYDPDLALPGGQNYRELLLTLPTGKPLGEWEVFGADGESVKGFETQAEAKEYAEEHGLDYERAGQGWINKGFRSQHWDEENVVVHIRFNERTDADGKKVLFIEEIQSDWATRGKKDGFRDEARIEKIKAEMQRAEDARVAAEEEARPYTDKGKDAPTAIWDKHTAATDRFYALGQELRKAEAAHPRGPFVADTRQYAMLAMKRAIRWAAENGFDRVAWTTGRQQQDRYSLRRVVESIRWAPRFATPHAGIGKPGQEITVATKGGGNWFVTTEYGDKIESIGGRAPVNARDVVGKPLEAIFGADVARKISSTRRGSMDGEGLEFGGEFHKHLYDRILPQEVGAYIKKWGGKVGTIQMSEPYTDEERAEVARMGDKGFPVEQPGFDITPEMRHAAMQGQPMFSIAPDDFNEKDYRPAVVAWAKQKWGDQKAPDGSTIWKNFVYWFGDSKVVDEDGRPLVVYHGTGKRFYIFDPKDPSTDGGQALAEDGIKASFFTDSAEQAGDFATSKKGPFARVMPVYLSMKNPLVIDMQGGWWTAAEDRVRGAYKGRFYDGVILKNVHDGATEGVMATTYITFRPEQIKSATGNRGTFDLKNPDIRFSVENNEYAEQNRLIRGKDRNAWEAAKKLLAYGFAPGGLLPEQAWAQNQDRMAALNASDWDVAHMLGVLDRAARKAYGRTIANTVRGFAGLPKATREYLGSILGNLPPAEDGSVGARPKDVPAEVWNVIVAMRKQIDGYSWLVARDLQDQIDELMPLLAQGSDQHKAEVKAKIKLLKTIMGNIGKYVHRSYRAYTGTGTMFEQASGSWRKSVPDATINKARAYLVERFMEEDEETGEPKMELEEATTKANALIEKMLANSERDGSFHVFVKTHPLGAKELSVLIKRGDLAEPLRELLGEHKSLDVLYASTMTKMSRLVWNQAFLRGIKESGMGVWLFEKEQPGYTAKIAIEGNAAMEPLNGLYTSKDIAKEFNYYLGTAQYGTMMKAWLALNGFAKWQSTIGSPLPTGSRNWQAGFLMALANGDVDFRNIGASLTGMREYFFHSGNAEQLRYHRNLVALGVSLDNPFAGELNQLLRDTNLENFLAGKYAEIPFKAVVGIFNKFYQFGDDFWKINAFENKKSMFLRHDNAELVKEIKALGVKWKSGIPKMFNYVNAGDIRKAGGSEDLVRRWSEAVRSAEVQAAKRVRDTYMTYSMVGKFIKALRVNPLVGVFVSFPSESIRTQVNNVRYIAADIKAGRKEMAARALIGMALAHSWVFAAMWASMADNDIDDDDEEMVRISSPWWQENSTFWFMPRKEDGTLRYVDTTYIDPYNIWHRPIAAMMRDGPLDERLISAARDFAMSFMGPEIGTRAITELVMNKNANTGKAIVQPGDSAMEASQKWAAHLANAMQGSMIRQIRNLMKALDGEVSKTRKYDPGDELKALWGVRVMSADPEITLLYKGYDFQTKLRSAAMGVYEVLRDPNKVDVDDLNDAYDRLLRIRNEAFSDMGTVIKAVENQGLEEREVSRLLKKILADKDVKAIIEGEVPEWEPSKASESNASDIVEELVGEEYADRIRKRYREFRTELRARRRAAGQ